MVVVGVQGKGRNSFSCTVHLLLKRLSITICSGIIERQRERESAMSASFCASDLWDLQLSWYTTNPDFTPCFHQSVLTYIPTAVLLLALPFQVDIRDWSHWSRASEC